MSTHTGDLADCDRTQVEHRSIGNPDLEPEEAESLSVGAAASVGPFSLSMDWFRINITHQPAKSLPTPFRATVFTGRSA